MKIIRLKFGGIFHHDGTNFFLKKFHINNSIMWISHTCLHWSLIQNSVSVLLHCYSVQEYSPLYFFVFPETIAARYGSQFIGQLPDREEDRPRPVQWGLQGEVSSRQHVSGPEEGSGEFKENKGFTVLSRFNIIQLWGWTKTGNMSTHYCTLLTVCSL